MWSGARARDCATSLFTRVPSRRPNVFSGRPTNDQTFKTPPSYARAGPALVGIGMEFVDVRRWRGPHFLGTVRPFVEQWNGTDNTESRYRLRGGRRFCYVASLGPSALVFLSSIISASPTSCKNVVRFAGAEWDLTCSWKLDDRKESPYQTLIVRKRNILSPTSLLVHVIITSRQTSGSRSMWTVSLAFPTGFSHVRYFLRRW